MQNIRNNLVNKLMNKVPEITIFFWIIKILCTTVGETAADFLNVNLNLGLTITSIITGLLLMFVLIFQFKSKKYVPATYWLTVFLISIFGTLVTDNLTDALGVPLELSTIVFTLLLAATFVIWYRKEKTLSIHEVNTRKREAFYWLAILFTFALGTAAGDLMAESLGLGYSVTGIIIAVIILITLMAWRLGLDSVLTFWIAYIMTRPLGASIGDYLSQSTANGGIGLGPTLTSVIFVAAIIITVIYLSITKKDQIVKSSSIVKENKKSAMLQVIIVLALFTLLAVNGYYFRHNALGNNSPTHVSLDAPLGDLSEFKIITEDTLALVQANKFTEAKTRVTDLETLWDDSQAKMKPMSPKDWSNVDSLIDKVLRQVRAVRPDAAAAQDALNSLLNALNTLDKKLPA